MYVHPQKHAQTQRADQATPPQINYDVERESDAACMLSAEADHSWSMR